LKAWNFRSQHGWYLSYKFTDLLEILGFLNQNICGDHHFSIRE
jgi:hypothetical protein